MENLPFFFGDKFGYLWTQSAFESFDLVLDISVTLSYVLFHAGVLLLHTLDEVRVQQLQESLHVIKGAFKLLHASLGIGLLAQGISKLNSFLIKLIGVSFDISRLNFNLFGLLIDKLH